MKNIKCDLENTYDRLLNYIFDENPTVKAIFNSVQVGIAIATDISCTQVIYNPIAKDFLGLNEIEDLNLVMEKIPVKIYHAGKRLLLEELPIQRAAWYGELTINKEIEFVFDNGVKKIALLSANPILGKAEKIIGAIATFQDITEQRKIAKEHEHFFELSLDSFIIMDFRGKVIKTNREFRKHLGYENDIEIDVKTIISEHIHPEDLEDTIITFNKISHSAEVVTSFVNRIRNKNGEYTIISWNCFPSKAEELIYLVGRNITEIRRKNQELLMSQQEKTDILESISDAFFSLDKDGRFGYINKEADRLFTYTASSLGKSKEELIGLSFWDTFPAYRNSEIYDILEKVRISKVPEHFETRMLYSQKEIDVNLYPHKEGVSVYFRDISERKRTEKEMVRLDKLKIVGEIAASISHEIRNPMTTVRGFLQILGEKQELKKNYKEQFDLMIEELDRANQIITEFLSLSSNSNTEFRSQNLNYVIGKILPMLQADALTSDKTIKLDLGQIPNIKLDEKGIRQVLLNLIRNGLESMSQLGVLTIKTITFENTVVLIIKDQGNGIPQEMLENLGKPFMTTKENGTGLGLAVCFKVLHEHGATIDFETSSEGTTVFIKFKTES